MKFIQVIFWMFFSFAVQAETLQGKVVGVTDGDTVTLLTAASTPVKIRLNAIDAPEKSQSFGQASKKSLSAICFGKSATVEASGTDKYGRTIGLLTCDGVNANEHQVNNGMAWVYRKYSQDPALISLEEAAKTNRVGLWDDPQAIPPWDFRHGGSVKAINPVSMEAVSTTSKFQCGEKRFCKEMTSCEEARFYLNQCGVTRLDRDHDGIPCESIC